jgi:hypothetical protein
LLGAYGNALKSSIDSRNHECLAGMVALLCADPEAMPPYEVLGSLGRSKWQRFETNPGYVCGYTPLDRT